MTNKSQKSNPKFQNSEEQTFWNLLVAKFLFGSAFAKTSQPIMFQNRNFGTRRRRTRRCDRVNEKGMTLIEIIVVMVLITVLAGFVGNVIFYGINTYEAVTNRKAGLQDSRFAVYKLTRDIREIVSPDSIYQASADSIRFDSVNNEMIAYRSASSKIFRNSDLLLENVTNFQFSYYNDLGNLMTFPINNLSKIRAVSVNLTTLIQGKPVISKVNVVPRNF